MAVVSEVHIEDLTFQEWDELDETLVTALSLPRTNYDRILGLKCRMLSIDIEHDHL